MTTTDSRTVLSTELLYDGEVLRVFWTDGERSDYGVNADNADRRWVIREHFTGYGQRCESFRDQIIPGFTFPAMPRESATRVMFQILANRGVTV